jgi:uncharacterized protein (DUF2267 family)
MSTGLPVFDTTVQETNLWLKGVEAHLPPCDRQLAYGALRAVLHVLRDRLPMEGVLALSAQLPMLLRGVFLEGWRPVEGPSHLRDPEDFAEAAAAHLPPKMPRQANEAVEAVFAVMSERLDPGEVAKLAHHLPIPLRSLFPVHA